MILKQEKKRNHFNLEIQQLITEAEKNHNHPYYEPKTIIKRNRYQIFEDNTDKKREELKI